MITRDNLEYVLLSIGFQEIQGKNKQYNKTFGNDSISVDFEKENINYPPTLTVNEHQTTNFSDKENFVVLECVCRLLDKGYHAKHIELEPRWQLGHGASGGRADILVCDENNIPLLIIECKTSDKYHKAYKDTEADGGQLFSYWQQENAVRWLGLYASDWDGEKVTYKSHVINCTDDQNVLLMAKKDKDILIYANAKNDNERFAVWDETYHKRWLDNVVFDDESGAYQIGIPPLRKGKLRDFTPNDKIVNRFEEILRHNNVSDKENAFNRLVALFICKLVDEITKQDFDEVDFQYKAGESYEDLQDRLQRLHQEGMEKFMKEKIFYVAGDYPEQLFQQYTGRQRKAAIEDLKNTIRILKFYSNNDFAFKDVHNEELFFQNGKILVEVVELFQPYRIVYPSKHQFLGDLFEQLLNKGFKQNEGQFFTPMPITRFIWDALPVQEYINRKGLPNVIDYACGAGHFLTEAVEAINAHRTDKDDNSWVEKHIFGIEKDYRLARVSKVSLFMNGAGDAKIIFGDGLENYPDKGIEENKFDILVANPPYSVDGFKQHLKLKNGSYRILDKISNAGKEIETLFVERIAQLVRPEGLAAVILPSTILSNNTPSSYIAAREELVKNFYIRAIVLFGSQTFSEANISTVTLFLERYSEPPRIAELVQDSVDAILSNTDLKDFVDRAILEDYLVHQGITENDYQHFLQRKYSWEEMELHPYFKIYTEIINLKSLKYPKKASDNQKAQIRLQFLYNYAFGVEQDKLYYFALVREQNTIVITSPAANKAQKEFLGYEWSKATGNEGIHITNKGGKLYDNSNRCSNSTLASIVRNTFMPTASVTPPEVISELKKYIAQYSLKDMFDFSRGKFDKEIKTIVAEKISSKYPLVSIKDYITVLGGLWTGKKPPFRTVAVLRTTNFTAQGFINLHDVAQIEVEEKAFVKRKLEIGDIIIEKSGGSETQAVGRVILFDGIEGEYAYSNFTARLRVTSSKLLPKYLHIVLNKYYLDGLTFAYQHGAAGLKNLDLDKYLTTTIPLPPISIQEKIISECGIVDQEYTTNRMSIELYRSKIAQLFDNLDIIRGGGKNT